MRASLHTEPEIDDEVFESDIYREIAKRFLNILYPAIGHVFAAQNPQIGKAQVLFAIGMEERSMRDVAAGLNVTVACISKGAKEFLRENNLPTPPCMKSEESSDAYRNARMAQLKD